MLVFAILLQRINKNNKHDARSVFLYKQGNSH